jgi:hypothetical protein
MVGNASSVTVYLPNQKIWCCIPGHPDYEDYFIETVDFCMRNGGVGNGYASEKQPTQPACDEQVGGFCGVCPSCGRGGVLSGGCTKTKCEDVIGSFAADQGVSGCSYIPGPFGLYGGTCVDSPIVCGMSCLNCAAVEQEHACTAPCSWYPGYFGGLLFGLGASCAPGAGC